MGAQQQAMFMRGASGGGVLTTWNPADKNASIALSGGDLIASGGTAVMLARATRSMPATDKCYWEVTLTGDTVSLLVCASGIVSGAVSTATQMGGPGANLGLYIHGEVLYYNNAVVFDFTNNASSPQTTMWGWEPSTRRVYAGLVGTGWFNSGDPAAGTGYVYTLPAGTFYPGCTPNNRTITANFGASAFGGSVPAGFVSFNNAT